MGFQWVASLPNPKCLSPNVFAMSASFRPYSRRLCAPFARPWRSAVRGRAFAWQVWARLMVTVDPDRENPKPNWNSVYWKGNVENSLREAARDLLGVREGRRQFQLRPRRLTPRVRRLKVLRPPPHHRERQTTLDRRVAAEWRRVLAFFVAANSPNSGARDSGRSPADSLDRSANGVLARRPICQ